MQIYLLSVVQPRACGKYRKNRNQRLQRDDLRNTCLAVDKRERTTGLKYDDACLKNV